MKFSDKEFIKKENEKHYQLGYRHGLELSLAVTTIFIVFLFITYLYFKTD